MTFSILIPHWRTLEMTSYTVAQFLKHKGNHEVDIIVIDNSFPDESIRGLEPFKDQITILNNTSEKLSSHGIAYDMAMPLVKTDWVITAESDSFPTDTKWLDYYEYLINKGYDCAGSLLRLSGGTYTHPAGALFRKSIWEEAKAYCDIIPYKYFPNMAMHSNFASHLMVHDSILNEFIAEPEDYIELADGYKPYSAALAESKRLHYSSTVNPFHNGMGNRDEDVNTYGLRTIESEAPTVLLQGKKKIIRRVGAEPGQWFSWYHAAMDKKVYNIPTEVKWLLGKENQQQERTIMENGFTHLWGVSAYHGTSLNDDEIARIKQTIPIHLYETLPEYQKIQL